MSMSKLAYCGFLQWYENMEGETVHNKLCIEFRSDDTNEQSNATDYLGFNITYSQRKGTI